LNILNNTRIVTIVCWIISAVALLGLTAWLIVGVINSGFTAGGGAGMGPFQLVSEHQVPMDQIESIDIDWTAGTVTVRAFHGNAIQISEFARHRLREDEQMSINTHGGTVSINFSQHRILRNNMPSKQLEVLIPYAMLENLQSLHINNIAGRVEVYDIDTNALSVSTTSGRVSFHGVSTDAINASTVSGRIELIDTSAGDAYLRSVSGRVEALNSEISNIDINATSGRIELYGSFEDIHARSLSGRIEVTSRTVPDSLIAHATSGRITITVPNEGEPISVQYQIGSGRFTSRVPVITHAGMGAQFNLSSTSGRIEILEFVR